MTLKSPMLSCGNGAPSTPADLFFEREASLWSNRYACRTYRQRRNLVLDVVRREFPNGGIAPRNFTALDFGCGSGVLVEDLCRTGISVTGVDRSRAMIYAAQSRLSQSHTAELECLSDDRPASYHCRTYNVILCLSVLEFVPDPEKLLMHLSSLLRLGGLLILTVPNQNSYLRRLERFGFEHPGLTRWIPGLSHLAHHDCYLRHQTQQFKAEALAESAKLQGLAVEDVRFHVAPKLFGSLERSESVGMMLMLTLRKCVPTG